MAAEPKSWAEMSADALRESAVLVLVFGLLDPYMFGHGLTAKWLARVLGLAALGFSLGGVLERSRRS